MKELIRISSLLDQVGNYKLSDKIFNKIVLSQSSAILAPPRVSVRPTAVLAPPKIAPINKHSATQNSNTCNLVTGIYANDIMQIKQLIQNELTNKIEPLKTNTTSMIFLECLSRSPKYSKQQILAFQNQSLRIKAQLSDTSKGKFYQIIYPLLKKYKVTENDLNLYRNKDEFTTQFTKMTNELLRELSIPGLYGEFEKTNEYQFLMKTYDLLIQRFNKP